MKTRKPRTYQTAFRLPIDMLARIEQRRSQLARTMPGISRADVVRSLITAGLKATKRAAHGVG